MDDIYTELIEFFKTQHELYGKQILLDGRLISGIDKEETAQTPFAQVSNAKTVTEPGYHNQNLGPLEAFHQEIKDCMNCPLGKTRTNFVFGVGNPDAELMFVGEAPGRDEDLQGKPFVGRAGQLLNLMLAAINIRRDEVYIANVLKCRPPNNRDPLPEEIESCEPYLLKQINMINPKLIVALGRFAAASLLRSKMALGVLRKQIHQYNNVPLIVTYHPAALLRNPLMKRDAWYDLKMIREILKNN